MMKVTIAGAGILGSQIAFQCAFKGFSVTVYDQDTNRARQRLQRHGDLWRAYEVDLGAGEEQLQAALDRLSFVEDFAQAFATADMVIESIPENLQIKSEFYRKVSSVVPAHTILATNSSNLLPSAIAPSVKSPGRFLALHFANRIHVSNIAEIMGHPGTDPGVFDRVVEFARKIGMVPLPLSKEQPGYIINSLLSPWLVGAIQLAMAGVATPETIDKTWMIAMRSPMGPFGLLDIIGMRTPYEKNLAAGAAGNENSKRIAEWFKTEFIDKKKFGVESGEGFYKYPNPKYLDPAFLKT